MGDIAITNDFRRPFVDLNDEGCPFRSILDLLDFNAEHNPDHTFAIQLIKDVDTDSTRQLWISFRDLRSAISACSKHLEQTVLRASSDEPAPVALLMASDVCLIFYLFALMHLKAPVVLLSARLSPSAIEHLLRATGASQIIASMNLLGRAKEAGANREGSKTVFVHEQEALEALMASGEEINLATVTSISSTRRVKNCQILHSSGTTGMLKPIYHTERYLLAFTTCHSLIVTPDGQCLSTLPLFHGYGLLPSCLALSTGMSICLPPRSEIPNAPAMVEHLRSVAAGSFVSVPSILEDMAASDGLHVLKDLGFVAFVGGKLKESVGDALSSGGVRLLNHFGATETGPLAPIFIPGDDYDWRYFRLRADAGIQLKEAGLNDDGRQKFRLSMQPPGWDSIFEIQDELVRAPFSTHQDYVAVGRTDDVIVLANGEKVRPGVLEAAITEHLDIKCAIAFGNEQTEIGVLLQPTTEVPLEASDRFVGSVWPEVAKANLLMDAHAQVLSKQCVLVITHEVVLPRSDKGSILRREVSAVFEAEILDVYAKLNSLTSKDLAEPLRLDYLEDDISALVYEYCHLQLKQGMDSHDEDLFARGLDSLQAVQLRRRLQAAMARSHDMAVQAESLPRDFIYRFPSVRKMANALRGVEPEGLDFKFDQPALDELVACYSTRLEAHAALVTGATGGLGSHMVEHLAKSSMVSTVFCLVPPTSDCSSTQRMMDALDSRGINLDEAAKSKLCVLECDLSQEDLGLAPGDYQRILTSVRWIVHAGWPMDFKLTLASFAPVFRALQNLLSLFKKIGGFRTVPAPKFVFISSISMVAYYTDLTKETVIPEVAMPEPACALDIGYARAKLYIRMGQLCGSPKTGLWNEEEHILALLKSSLVIGAVPEMPGTMSWIPVDQAAEVACDILLDFTSTRLVFHVESPVQQSWADILSIIRRHLGLPDTMAYDQWLGCLSKTLSSESPAAKLLPFFKTHFERMACGKVCLDTSTSRSISPALRRVAGVSDVDVGRYIARWRESGFLR